MGALICIYVFFPLLKYAFDNKKDIFYYFTIMAAIFTFGNRLIAYSGSVFLDLFFGKSIVLKGNLFNMFNPFRGIYGYSFVFFCVGGIAHDTEEKILKVKHRNLISCISILCSCLLLFLVGVLFSNAQGSLWDVVWDGYDTIFTFVNVICIYTLCLGYKGNFSIVKMISCNTLGIFFMHNIFIRLTKDYVVTLPLLDTYIGNIIYVTALILVCLLATLIIKKIPIIKNLVKLG